MFLLFIVNNPTQRTKIPEQLFKHLLLPTKPLNPLIPGRNSY